MHLTRKQRIEKVNQICEFYKTDKYTIASCCENIGLHERTFDGWIKNYSELAELYKKAKEYKLNVRKKRLKELALTSYEKKLKGWEWEEITIEGYIDKDDKEGKEIKKKRIKKVKKFQIPDTALIIFALCNHDSENFKNSQNIDHTSKGESFHIDFSKMTREELIKLRNGLNN